MKEKKTTTMLIFFIGVFILPQVLANAEVAPRDPEAMTELKLKNDKQLVDEPAVKECLPFDVKLLRAMCKNPHVFTQKAYSLGYP